MFTRTQARVPVLLGQAEAWRLHTLISCLDGAQHAAPLQNDSPEIARSLQFGVGEEVQHLLFGRRLQDIVLREVVGLGVAGFANALGGLIKVVDGAAKMDVVIEEEPVGAGFPERHADAAGVYHTDVSDFAIELHVSVAANYYRGVDSGENGNEFCFRSEFGEDFVFVAWSGVAEEDSIQVRNLQAKAFGPGGDEAALVCVELLAGPADCWAKLVGNT
jgi:hypothetical protein